MERWREMKLMTKTMYAPMQKRVFLVWVTVYPLITALMWILEPFMQGWAMPLRTFLLSILMVPIMVCFAMPLVNTLMNLGEKS